MKYRLSVQGLQSNNDLMLIECVSWKVFPGTVPKSLLHRYNYLKMQNVEGQNMKHYENNKNVNVFTY